MVSTQIEQISIRKCPERVAVAAGTVRRPVLNIGADRHDGDKSPHPALSPAKPGERERKDARAAPCINPRLTN